MATGAQADGSNNSGDASATDVDAGRLSSLPNWPTFAAWLIIAFVYGMAYTQGSEFASTKKEATFFGCVIGLAAFFAWLGVDLDKSDDEDLDEDGDDDDCEHEDEKRAWAKNHTGRAKSYRYRL